MFHGYNQGFNVSTPNISISEGLRPAQHYAVAGYLPLERYDNVYMDYKVISHGKIVGIDSGNYIVPAGLIKDIELAVSLGAGAWADTSVYGYVYSATDVAQGIKNFAGAAVEAAEAVVKSFFTSGDATQALLNNVCGPIGLAPQDIWRQNGAGYGAGFSAGNPADYTMTNFNLQQGTTVWTHGFVELPVVADTSELKLPGMVVFEGTPNLASGLVTFNNKSNFVSVPLYTVNAAADGNPTDAELTTMSQRLQKLHKDIVGRLLFVDNQWPKSLLEVVRTWEPATTLGTPATPGSATKGLPDNLFLAGVIDPASAKTVRINFLIH